MTTLSSISSENFPNNSSIRNVQDILDDIVDKTKNIPTGYLFNNAIGQQLLQKLARCLCGTKESQLYAGWQCLGNELGLDPLLQKSLANWNINNEDPVYNMFLAYTEIEEPNISNIYKALFAIERYDVIVQTQPLVREFYQEMNNIFGNSIKENMLQKPITILKLPHIIKNLNKSYDKSKIETFEKILDYKTQEILCRSEPVINESEKQVEKYDKTVMLTYCYEDEQYALEIAKKLRKTRNGKNIKVFTLEEQSQELISDPETAISKYFPKINFIIPILTPDYFDSIAGEKELCSPCDNLDGACVTYIYNLMRNNYLNNSCKNFKIRCIIPDDEKFKAVQKHPYRDNPEFRIWTKLSGIDKFAEKIIASSY